jgi:hypothetical protein
MGAGALALALAQPPPARARVAVALPSSFSSLDARGEPAEPSPPTPPSSLARAVGAWAEPEPKSQHKLLVEY